MSLPSANLLFVFAALLAGAMVAAQGMVNGKLGMVIGSPTQAALISFSGGWVLLLAVNVFTGQGLPGLQAMSAAPWWAFLGGIAGAYLVAMAATAVPRIGAGAWVSAVMAGQLTAAILYDHFGFFGQPARPVSLEKILGVAAMGVGVWLIRRG